MKKTIVTTNYKFPNQTKFYKGKVRDVYTINNDLLIMITTDRISAFDVVLPVGVPYKGQVLNQIAAKFLDSTADIVPNWKIATPDQMVTIGRLCEPFKVEMVIRGYLSGHAWREYNAGKRELCGVKLPDGMKENDKFEQPIITPTTKEAVGHDEDISREEILSKGIVDEKIYSQLEKYTQLLFQRGTEIANKAGLILVDTKYEFGIDGDTIYLIDEIHTPDSSRYFYADDYEVRQANAMPQKQLSKEFVREWLMSNGFSGQQNETMPKITDKFADQVSERYIELFESITGDKFIKADISNVVERVEKNILSFLKAYYR